MLPRRGRAARSITDRCAASATSRAQTLLGTHSGKLCFPSGEWYKRVIQTRNRVSRSACQTEFGHEKVCAPCAAIRNSVKPPKRTGARRTDVRRGPFMLCVSIGPCQRLAVFAAFALRSAARAIRSTAVAPSPSAGQRCERASGHRASTTTGKSGTCLNPDGAPPRDDRDRRPRLDNRRTRVRSLQTLAILAQDFDSPAFCAVLEVHQQGVERPFRWIQQQRIAGPPAASRSSSVSAIPRGCRRVHTDP